MYDQTLFQLCDPSAHSLEEAIRIARNLMVTEPLLDVKLAQKLPGRNQVTTTQLEGKEAERALEILDAISEGRRLLHVLGHLTHDPNPRLRSKAAVLIGRRVQNFKFAEKYFGEVDPRVRANIIEAIWGVNSPPVLLVLRRAAGDDNNRVAGNALYGLYSLSDSEALPQIRSMARHPRPEFRTTAAWTMGKTGDRCFLEDLKLMLRDENAKVRSVAFRAIMEIKKAVA